jgi:hypothetical protein
MTTTPTVKVILTTPGIGSRSWAASTPTGTIGTTVGIGNDDSGLPALSDVLVDDVA